MDKDPANNKLDNLAFLCLAHHDQYDSKPSQSKGLTLVEVKKYRDELYENVGNALSQKVHFGQIAVDESDPYAGRYTRLGGDKDSAELVLTPLPDSMERFPRYFASGLALAGSWKPGGPNIGDFGGIVEFEEKNSGVYSRGDHRMFLRLDGDILMVDETFQTPVYGMGVTFEGTYRRS